MRFASAIGRSFVLLACAVASATGVAGADTVIVSPNTLTSAEGNNGFKIPFSNPPARYQQIHSATEFGALAEPGIVTQIALRANTNAAVFSVQIPSVEIRLSTSTAEPDSISGTFADNAGPDETLVYAGALDFASSQTGAGPRPFNLLIPITEPFVYDPTAGNLLFDVTVLSNPSGGTIPFLDGASIQKVVRVFCASGCSAQDSSGQTGDGILALEFSFAPAPEPHALASGVVAVLALVAARGRRPCRSAARA